jgi:hypothetical protein
MTPQINGDDFAIEGWAHSALVSIGRSTDIDALAALAQTANALGRADVADAATARIGACCAACAQNESQPASGQTAVSGYGSAGVFGRNGKYGGGPRAFGTGRG